MDLCQEVLSGFEFFSEVNSSSFETIVRTTFDIILRLKQEEDLVSALNNSVSSFVLKSIHASLVTFILEGARIDADPLRIRGVLEENNVPSDKVDLFVDVYAQKRRALQLLLSTTTFTFPNIVDVKWQLNYCIKSNRTERIDEPTYYITLKTEQGVDATNNSEIEFCCTMDELKDLVDKLKSAVSVTPTIQA